jgi:hypothetical protein
MSESMKKFLFPALWILDIIGFAIYRTLAFNENAYNVSLTSIGEFMTIIAILAVITLLAVVLKGPLFRLLNIIAGIIFLVIQIIMFVDGITSYPSATFNIATGATIVVLATLVIFAFRLPKKTG